MDTFVALPINVQGEQSINVTVIFSYSWVCGVAEKRAYSLDEQEDFILSTSPDILQDAASSLVDFCESTQA